MRGTAIYFMSQLKLKARKKPNLFGPGLKVSFKAAEKTDLG
jgi:hypothetical protein